MDIIVTTPKNKMSEAAQEAEDMKSQGGGYYFRVFPIKRYPKNLFSGDKVFYVEDGYIRGFCEVSWRGINTSVVMCFTTGKLYPMGYLVLMKADSWKWIKPIPMKGFQGFRYAKDLDIEVVGGWKDARPDLDL